MRLLFVGVLALLAFLSVSEGVKYSQPLQGTKDYIYLHGGVKFDPVPFEDACAAKTFAKSGTHRSALFLVNVEPNNDVALALCSGASERGPNGLDPYLLGTSKVNRPDVLVTTKTYRLSPQCEDTVHDWGRKERNKALLNLWDDYDGYCQEEFGADYRAARAQEALFYLDGSSPVVGHGVALAGHYGGVIANVRGGYIYWISGAWNFADNAPQSFHIPWTIGTVYSDCYTGLYEEASEERKKQSEEGLFCSAPNAFSNGFISRNVFIPGSYSAEGRAPIMCRRIDAPVKMLVEFGGRRQGASGLLPPSDGTSNAFDTCSYAFGSAYTPVNPDQLSRNLKSAFFDIRQFGTGGGSLDDDIAIPLGSYDDVNPYFTVYQNANGLLRADKIGANSQCGLRQTTMCQNRQPFRSVGDFDYL